MTRTYPMSSQAVHLNSYDAYVFAKRAGQKIIGYLKKKMTRLVENSVHDIIRQRHTYVKFEGF